VVFPNSDGSGPLDGREFDRLVFRPALKRAGIREFRWKDLRHTFATRLRMTGFGYRHHPGATRPHQRPHDEALRARSARSPACGSSTARGRYRTEDRIRR